MIAMKLFYVYITSALTKSQEQADKHFEKHCESILPKGLKCRRFLGLSITLTDNCMSMTKQSKYTQKGRG